MNDFAIGLLQVYQKPLSRFPNVLFVCLEATTQIIKYTISEKVIQWGPARHMF